MKRPAKEPIKVTANGKTLTLAEWAMSTGIPLDTLYKRYRNGWDESRIVQREARQHRGRRFIEFGGEKLTIAEWSKRLGLSRAVLSARLSRGLSLESALTGPKQRSHRGRRNDGTRTH